MSNQSICTLTRKRRMRLDVKKLCKDPIACLIHTRRLMHTLLCLGLKTPDPGLKKCKDYFERCRYRAGYRDEN